MISERDYFKNTLTVTTAVFHNRFSFGKEKNRFVCIDQSFSSLNALNAKAKKG